jgi:predicted amidohydrolase
VTDLVFVGARVVDPASGLDDATRAVGVSDGKVTYVGSEPIPAETTVDVAGLVFCPGFIDLHSHAQSVNGLRLQALDGVTSAPRVTTNEMRKRPSNWSSRPVIRARPCDS